jgi:type I restriction enzyme S subunit
MKKVPKLRLKGFEGEWKETYLGKVSKDSSYGLGAEAIPFDGKNKYIRITDIDDESRLYKPKPVVSPSFFYPNYEVKENDMLFARTGASVGKTYLYNKTDGLLYYAGFLIKMNIFEGDAKFIFSQTLRRSYFNWIISESQRSGQPGINLQQLKTYSFLAPSYDEQQSIGNFFQTLDNLLAEQQNKLENLQKVKKSMLSKMFPKEGQKVPEIRFKGFDGDWEICKLSDISKKVTEKNTSLNYDITLTNSAEFGIINQIDFFDHAISNTENIGSYFVVRQNDFVYNPRISVTAPVGPINCNQLGYIGVMSPLYYVFRVFGLNIEYLNQYYKTSNWHSYMKLMGNTGARFDRFSISDKDFADMPIPYPKAVGEQERIAGYFVNLNNLITEQSQRLDKLKQIKSACLQKMFV